MIRVVKTHVRAAAHAMGYEIVNAQNIGRNTLFSSLDIDLLIDVGANKGQYALARRKTGYKGDIISFEPLSAAHQGLLTLAETDPNWTIADRMAVGDRTGEIEINLARNSASSSVLPMLGACLAAEPQAVYIGKETVPLRRLDDVLASKIVGRNIFLKLDVQGFENYVLRGAEHIVAASLGLQLEMSLVPLYEGETLMSEMLQLLLGKGFALWDLQPGFRDPATGRLLQVDGIFTKAWLSQHEPKL